jgi:hypothetical protein
MVTKFDLSIFAGNHHLLGFFRIRSLLLRYSGKIMRSFYKKRVEGDQRVRRLFDG